jgi:Predicted signal transduction protein with a C-terminal ATPase domain
MGKIRDLLNKLKKKIIITPSKKKIGTSLILLFIVCTVMLIVLPILYIFFFSSALWDQAPLEQYAALDSDVFAITGHEGQTIYVSSPEIKSFFPAQQSNWESGISGNMTVHLRVLSDANTGGGATFSLTGKPLVSLVTVVYVLVFLLIIFIMKSKVYDPITKVEQMLHGVVKGETNFNFEAKESDPFFPMFSDLNLLFENIKTLTYRESSAQLIKKQAELDALQSQINPHFLYNTLEAIRGQATEYGLKDIELMTRALSRLFRYSISNHNALVTLREELENVENYLFIQHLRFNNKFIKTSRIDEDTLDYKVPKLIIQPIVENAIYHGLEMKIGQGQICISAHLTRTRLVVSIRDDGLGISESKLRELNVALAKGVTQVDPSRSKSSSVGLRNVNARIRLTYGSEYGLSIYSTEKIGTDVQLSLPRIQ